MVGYLLRVEAGSAHGCSLLLTPQELSPRYLLTLLILQLNLHTGYG